MLGNNKIFIKIVLNNIIIIIKKENFMYSFFTVRVGICIGCSPLGNS